MFVRSIRVAGALGLATASIAVACANGTANSVNSGLTGGDDGGPTTVEPDGAASGSGSGGSGSGSSGSGSSGSGSSGSGSSSSGSGDDDDSGGSSSGGEDSGGSSSGGEDSGSSSGSGSGSSSGGVDAAPPPTCTVAGVSPTYKAPTGTTSSCSSSDVNNFWNDCLGSNAGLEYTCETASSSPVGSACFECLVANSPTNSTWGVMVLDSNIWELNQGGCYAAQSASQQACAQAEEYQQQCENTECASKAGGSSVTPFQNCVTAADGDQCECYVTAATSACAAYTSSACNFPSTDSLETAFKAAAGIECE